MNNLKVKNFMWSTIGAVIFGFTSLFFMIITTRINGIDIAGAFTYAFANACVFWTIGSYSGKTFQITETDEKYSDSDYLHNKATTCLVMNIIAIIFCLITRPGILKTILIILLTIYRSIDAMIDSIHAIVQRNGELYKAGKSMFFRTIILVFAFALTDYLTKNIILSCIVILIINILFCCVIDYRFIKNKYRKTKYNSEKNKLLLKIGFSVFLYSFFATYVLNIPKYAINTYSTDEIQAIFGIIIMPASFLALISQYIVQPFLNNITENIKKKNYKQLYKYICSIGSCIIAIGLFAIVLCYFIGIPVLEIVYGVALDNQLNNLLIILLGSIFYSLVILISAIFIALRKTILQLILLIVTAICSLFLCYLLTRNYGIAGASIAYTIITGIEFILHLGALIMTLREKKKKISVRLMGGLGNQMFEYAALRAMMIKYNQKGIISLKGITNKTHNIYSLNHFNINQEVEVINNESLKSKLNYLIYGFYYVFLIKHKNGFSIMKKIQPFLNKIGIFCLPDGYIKFSKCSSNNNTMVGYFQSIQYFNDYKDIIKKELKVVDAVLEDNKKLLKEIEANNSVCVHIRRGDYVGTNHQVCDEAYYLKAIEIMKKKVKNPQFYIFSDDIKWVKENIHFKDKVNFVEKNNPNYEELRLMYSCKHFIISNSSFSWWAQYLTENKKRITIAPSKWFQNENQKVDIYEEDWIKL